MWGYHGKHYINKSSINGKYFDVLGGNRTKIYFVDFLLYIVLGVSSSGLTASLANKVSLGSVRARGSRATEEVSYYSKPLKIPGYQRSSMAPCLRKTRLEYVGPEDDTLTSARG